MKAMNPGVSSLNPYAASYIPVAKRETNDNLTANDIKYSDQEAWFEPSSHIAHNPYYSNASLDSKRHQVSEGSAVKTHPARCFFMQNPGEMTDKHIVDEEFDMDLEYLRMTFPGLSNESILDVYLANDGDFEATVDMLNQLEPREDECMHTVEPSETLPDTLDIGYVSESGSSATCGALKLKNMAAETSAYSSGTAESAVAS